MPGAVGAVFYVMSCQAVLLREATPLLLGYNVFVCC